MIDIFVIAIIIVVMSIVSCLYILSLTATGKKKIEEFLKELF